MSPENFLGVMERSYGITWYYDGSLLYLYNADQIRSEMLTLDKVSPSSLKRSIQSLGLYDERFSFRYADADGLVYVSGPPRYIDVIKKTARAMEANLNRPEKQKQVVRVFRLKNAWADDVTFQYGDHEVEVPGVATVVRNIIMGKTSDPTLDYDVSKPEKMKKLKGTGLVKPKQDDDDPIMADEEPAPRPGGHAQSPAPKPSIMADPRMNAVIVRDLEDTMDAHEELINELDHPVRLVEIQATIVDVSTDNVEDLGLGLSAGGGDNFQFHANANIISEGTSIKDLVSGSGLNYLTLYTTGVNFFMAQAHMLEQEGKASILARPTVLTTDNAESVLEHTSTFYVRLTGEKEVDLVDVTSGTVLRVTPHVVDEPDGRHRIKLIVRIDDGSSSSASQGVDDIPIVSRTSINTQAEVLEFQSLLIGGYYYEKLSENEDGVPLLRNIPALGYLFKQNTNQSMKMERFFLITPRIVDPLAARPPAPTRPLPVPEPSPVTVDGKVRSGCARVR